MEAVAVPRIDVEEELAHVRQAGGEVSGGISNEGCGRGSAVGVRTSWPK